jgi:hypothetical protein
MLVNRSARQLLQKHCQHSTRHSRHNEVFVKFDEALAAVKEAKGEKPQKVLGVGNGLVQILAVLFLLPYTFLKAGTEAVIDQLALVFHKVRD